MVIKWYFTFLDGERISCLADKATTFSLINIIIFLKINEKYFVFKIYYFNQNHVFSFI